MAFHGGGGGIGGAINTGISGVTSNTGGGGGGDPLGDLFGFAELGIGLGAGFGSQELANSTAQDFAKIQRRFAKKQYGTRYQITMNDLRAAGLNPLLAMNPGVAGSPLGAQTAAAGNPAGAAGASAGAAASAARASGVRARTEQKKVDARLAHEVDLMDSQRGQADAARDRFRSEQGLFDTRRDLLQQDLPAARLRANFDRRHPEAVNYGRGVEHYGSAGPIGSLMGPIGSGLTSAADFASSFARWAADLQKRSGGGTKHRPGQSMKDRAEANRKRRR